VQVESIECNQDGTIVTFKNRSDAEFALPQYIGQKFKNQTTLKYVWYEDKPSTCKVETVTENSITAPTTTPPSPQASSPDPIVPEESSIKPVIEAGSDTDNEANNQVVDGEVKIKGANDEVEEESESVEPSILNQTQE
jgi:hypothetical protein